MSTPAQGSVACEGTPYLFVLKFPDLDESRRAEAEHRNRAAERAASFEACVALTEDEQHKVATCIAEHLESTNWKIEQGPVREGHGPKLMSK
jgi:hypothetical protein